MPGAFHNTEQYANNRIESQTMVGSKRGCVRCAASNATAPRG